MSAAEFFHCSGTQRSPAAGWPRPRTGNQGSGDSVFDSIDTSRKHGLPRLAVSIAEASSTTVGKPLSVSRQHQNVHNRVQRPRWHASCQVNAVVIVQSLHDLRRHGVLWFERPRDQQMQSRKILTQLTPRLCQFDDPLITHNSSDKPKPLACSVEYCTQI
jgi:hypothetical protein